MKKGDLVKMCTVTYPQYANQVGVLVRSIVLNPAEKWHWEVLIDGRTHPFGINEDDMVLLS